MTRRRRTCFEATALLLLGSQGVHDLRFVAEPEALADHGDGHLHVFVTGPAIAAVIASVLVTLLVRAAATPGPGRTRPVRVRRLWPLAALALMGVYGSQELVEG